MAHRRLARSKSPIPKSKLYLTQPETSISTEHPTPEPNLKIDETQEISVTLSMVRKLHDQAANDNQKKRVQIERLRKEVETAQAIRSSSNSEYRTLQNRIEQLQNNLQRAKTKHDEELMNKKVYLHVLDRMKQDKIAIERSANDLKRSLKSATQVMLSEAQRLRKSQEACAQSKSSINQLKNDFQEEKRLKQLKITELERVLKQRHEALSRREDRKAKQQEIIAAAAEMEKSSQEYKNRETMLLNKFWFKVLSIKLDKEQKRAAVLEQAFQQIKNATGFKSIQEIVERFLTREQTYTELMQQVATTEQKLNKLKEDNERARQQLTQMTLTSDTTNYIEFHQQIHQLEEEMHTEQKQLIRDEERYKKLSDIHDRTSEWTNRIMSKLNIYGKPPTSLQIGNSKTNLAECLDKVSEKVNEMFEELKSLTNGNVTLINSPEVSEITKEHIARNVRFTQRALPDNPNEGRGFEVTDDLVREANIMLIEQEEKARYRFPNKKILRKIFLFLDFLEDVPKVMETCRFFDHTIRSRSFQLGLYAIATYNRVPEHAELSALQILQQAWTKSNQQTQVTSKAEALVQLKTANAVKDFLAAKIKKQDDKIEELNKQVEAGIHDIKIQRQINAKSNAKVVKLQEKLIEVQQHYQEVIDDLQDDNKQARAQIESLESQVSSLSFEKEELSRHKKLLRGEVLRLRADHTKALEELGGYKEALLRMKNYFDSMFTSRVRAIQDSDTNLVQ